MHTVLCIGYIYSYKLNLCPNFLPEYSVRNFLEVLCLATYFTSRFPELPCYACFINNNYTATLLFKLYYITGLFK